MNRVPFLSLAAAVLLGAIVVAFSALYALRAPSLGVHLQAGPPFVGAVVSEVAPDGPSATILTPNDVIVAIGDARGATFALEAPDLVPDPDFFPRFSILNGFYERQAALANILDSPVVSLALEDGRVLRVQPRPARKLSFLPLDFWLLNLIGAAAFLAGFSVWSVRRHETAPRFLLGTGFFFFLMAAVVAVISTRELVLPAGILRGWQLLYHAVSDLFAVAVIGLLCHYPRRLTRGPVLPVLLALVVPFWLNELFQWSELPGHSILIQVPIYFVTALGVSYLQWRRVQHRPADRAAYRWFSLSLFVCIGLSLAVYYGPLTLLGSHEVPLSVRLGILLLLYVGLSLGVLRYNLFNLDRWWFDIWLWFLAGAALVLVDVGLVFFASLTQPVALTISLLLIGWCYFPLRLWVWNRIYRPSRRPISEILPLLMEGLLENSRSTAKAVEESLQRVFRPSYVTEVEPAPERAELREDGEVLYVPALDGHKGLALHFADRGARLFSPADVNVANQLLLIVRRTEDRLLAYNRGVEEERERIMRDLHDEVGGRLLSIVHSAAEPSLASLARDALGSLRDIIYSLSPEGPVNLMSALGKWHYDCKERCEKAQVRLCWEESISAEESLQLSVRQWINLSRVLFEVTTNALKHAKPTQLAICWALSEEGLRVNVCNDGLAPRQGEIRPGKGLKNMQNRLEEIGGCFVFNANTLQGQFEVEFLVPLSL